MNENEFLVHVDQLAAAGYEPRLLNGKTIRLRRGGTLYCPLGAVCDYVERTTIRGRIRRHVRQIRARVGRNRYRHQSIIELGSSNLARLWARITLHMSETETDRIVRAADAWDMNAETKYDRRIRHSMEKGLGLTALA
ncbi:MAG TPA: hypothetical protein VN495_04260 [Candidatus Paceibacterota bacterium]|nr:hypothetical protein [Candidatus Paceibacterota bacterium]